MAKNNKNKRITGIFPKKGYAVVFLLMALVAVGFMAMMTVVDAIPADMTMMIIAVLFALLIVGFILLGRRSKAARIVGLVVAFFCIALYGMGTYYLANTYATFAKLSDSSESALPAGEMDLANEPFNIYITGIDQWESEKGKDLERSDVNMIVTVNPVTRRILLTSIPRDAYVKLHTAQQMDKLTHTGVYGVDETINTVQDWLGVDLNYYVKMNFTAVVDVINAIGGVDVYSPKEFVPTKRDWWTVKKGWNHMNGKQALAFARERKAFKGEDSKRVENQQRVVDAILKKLMTSPALLTSYPDILKAASDNMSTNMTSDEMQQVVKMQLADLGIWDIQNQKITGEYDMDYVASLTQSQKFLVYKTKKSSVDECLAAIDAVMNPTEEEIRQVEEERKKNTLIKFIKGLTGKSGEEAAEETAEE